MEEPLGIMYKDYLYDKLYRKLKIANFMPLDVLVVGSTGAGKSTTLNKLFGKEITKVGMGVNPETVALQSHRLNSMIRFWDTPGLGDGLLADYSHSKKIIDLLCKKYEMNQKEYGFIDLVLLIIEGSNRDMGTTYKLINEILLPYIESSRILIVINQADLAMKGRHWIEHENKPDYILQDFLEKQALSIQKRILEATEIEVSKPVYYSAENDFNIYAVLELIHDSIPMKRRESRNYLEIQIQKIANEINILNRKN